MDVPFKKDLAGYLVLNEGKYYATEKFKQYPKSRLAVASKLQDWAYSTQRTIADFGTRD